MDIIDGEIVRTRSEWIAMIISLMKRSLLALSLAALVVAGVFVGYTSRSIIDAWISNPMSLDQITTLVRTYAKSLDGSSNIPVIYPDPAPTKLCLDQCPSKTMLGDQYEHITKPIVPNLGQPKPVKTYRISPSGQIIGVNPFSAPSETL